MPIDRIKLPDNTVEPLRDSTKQEKLVSGENIKTINGESILGSGNITIDGGGGGDMSAYEVKANKVTTISASSTNEQYPSAKAVYDAIMAGGTVEEDIPDVIFIDYDGTVTNSYSRDDFAFLTQMPANPTHEGLTSEGWNWTLADAKDYVSKYGRLVIGQMYVTSDGKTYFGIRIDDTTLDFFSFKTTGSGSVVIDWGDGTVETTTPNTHTHTYAAKGEYVISFSKESRVGFDWAGGGTANQTRLNNAPLTWVRLGDFSGQLTGGGFARCFNLETITMPSGITRFGNNWFQGCESLKTCVVPDTVSAAGYNMWDSCYEMKYISLSKTTPVSTNYFSNCRELLEVNIPQVITNIGNATFSNCYKLLYATMPDGLTGMGNNVFYFCLSLRELMLPDTLTSINYNSFDTCFSLKQVSISCNVPNVCFAWNISLESVEASGLIGQTAFNTCVNLSKVKLGSGCESIAQGAFTQCQNLKEIVLPEGLVSIGNAAFSSCRRLERVYIPSTLQTLGQEAFRACIMLREVDIDPSASFTINYRGFEGCGNLERINLSGATSIDREAFSNCLRLRDVKLNEALTGILSNTFYNCQSLTSIQIPANVTHIDTYAFRFCMRLKEMYVYATTPPTAGGDFLRDTPDSLTIHVPAGTLSAYQSATNWSAHASKMVEMDE